MTDSGHFKKRFGHSGSGTLRGVLPFIVLILCGFVLVPAPAAAGDARRDVSTVVPETVSDLAEIEKRVAEVITQCKPATVSIASQGGAGSGVIVSADGYVLTAGHVSMTPGRRVVVIMPDGRRLQAKTLGVNVGIDAGLVKITDKGPWPFVQMADADALKPGQWVVAMGHPGGFDKERSVVTRLGRVFRVRDSVIQSDCTIIGGDSGGPLFDLDGKVVGIHSRISRSLRQNYHVPVAQFSKDWTRLASSEVWNRPMRRGGPRPGGPYIGVRGKSGFATGKGAEIGRVYEGSPAEKAGLKTDDIVVEIDRSPVGSFGDLSTLVGKLSPGDRASIVVERDGKRVALQVVIGKAGG